MLFPVSLSPRQTWHSFAVLLDCSHPPFMPLQHVGRIVSSQLTFRPMTKPPSEYRRFDAIKSLLVRIGSQCSPAALQLLQSSVNYLQVGRWMRQQGFRIPKQTSRRRDLFDQIAASIGGKRVLYLEFGVASGNSMRYWSALLKNPVARLHGFDTFNGLPHDWHPGDKKGAYSTNGNPPQIPDPRVQFFIGLFEDTLPHYTFPQDYEALVINIDCDLYSSAAFVLKSLSSYIRPGTFLYFDEFAFDNELRAFHEFQADTGKRFTLLAATKAFAQVAFQCIPDVTPNPRSS